MFDDHDDDDEFAWRHALLIVGLIDGLLACCTASPASHGMPPSSIIMSSMCARI